MHEEVCVHDRFYPTILVATLQLPPQAKTPVITYICTMQMESVCITMTMFPNRTNMLSILFLSTGHHGAPPVLPDQRLLLMKKIITRMEKPIWAYVKSQDTLYIFTINKIYNLYISRIYILETFSKIWRKQKLLVQTRYRSRNLRVSSPKLYRLS